MNCRGIANALMPWLASRRTRSPHRSRQNRVRPNLESLGDRVVPASISGVVNRDLTGNGLTADDQPLGGVTVNLYWDLNGNGVLNPSDIRLGSAVSAADGSYSFSGLWGGRYLVSESVPGNSVLTAPTPGAVRAVNLSGGQSVTGQDFDNFLKVNTGSVTNISFTVIRPDGSQSVVTNLRGHTHSGDTVVANFTVAANASPVVVSLVTYNAPGPSFDAHTAGEQTIVQNASGTFGPGPHSLTVTIPDNYYQVDFIGGLAIDHFGPAGGNIFYGAECRLLSADNGGTQSVPTGSLSGKVFFDANQNGIQESGDSPFGGVALTLLKTVNGNTSVVTTITTDENGNYSFTGLGTGNYTIRETQPVGDLDDGNDYAGSLGGTPGNIDDIAGISLTNGQAGVNYNFTEHSHAVAGTGSLSGSVGLVSEDGGQLVPLTDGSGNPVPVTVQLQLLQGADYVTVATVTTGSDGSFTFDGLVAGTYRLVEIVPDGFQVAGVGVGTVNGAQDGAAGDDTTTGAPVTVTATIKDVVLGAGQNGSDYLFVHAYYYG